MTLGKATGRIVNRIVASAMLISGAAALQVPQGVFKFRKAKLKAGSDQSAGDDAPALAYQLRLGPEQKRSDFQHPAAGRQTKRYPADTTHRLHQLAVRHRIGRRKVHAPADIVAFDEPMDSGAKILLMNPGNVLAARRHVPAESQAHQAP